MENSPLIDFSIEDDFFISNSPPDFRLSVAMENRDKHKNFEKFVGDKSAAEMFNNREKLSMSRSNGSGRATNSRDSLAWDSAFFTSAGVLDPDELFVINEGFEKAEARKRKSTYSGYMFDTYDFFLEDSQNAEADLLQDVKESIKKCRTRANMFSKAQKQKNYISKKLDYMSQTKVKSMPTSRKQSLHKQESERIEKRIANPLVSQIREKNGNFKSFSPQPSKISGRVNLTPTGTTRNVTRSVDNVKIQHRSTSCSSVKGLISSKKSRLGKSSCSNNSMSSPVTSSSLSLAESSDSTSYCSLFGSAASFRTSSNSRTEKGSWKNKLSRPVSSFRTPPRCSLQVQNDLECPNSSTYLSSFSNDSLYNSTATTINKNSIEVPLVTNTNMDRNMIPSGRNGDTSAELTRGSKPSCLRMPSPKLGFFDKEHCSADFMFHTGSHCVAPLIKGVKPKTRPWISTPVSSQDRRLSPLSATRGYSERKPVISESPKLPVKPLTSRSYPVEGVLENRIEQERKERAPVSTIFGRPIKKKPSPRQSSPFLLGEGEKENLSGFEDRIDGLSRYFGGINLKSDTNMNIAPNVLSKPGARTPLANTQCVSNGIDNGQLDRRAGNLVSKHR